MHPATRLVRCHVALLLALSAVPAAAATPATAELTSCVPADRTGTFRITLRRDGAEPMPGLLILERAAGCLSALLVTEKHAAPLDSLSITGDVFSAVLRTERGTARITLRFGDGGSTTVTGSVVRGRKTWEVVGERTS